MRTILTIIFWAMTMSLYAQNAYIQVEAEPGTSVFPHSSFKQKATSEIRSALSKEDKIQMPNVWKKKV